MYYNTFLTCKLLTKPKKKIMLKQHRNMLFNATTSGSLRRVPLLSLGFAGTL